MKRALLWLVSVSLGACGGSGGTATDLSTPQDLAAAVDQAVPDLATPDLAPPRDLATPDLATPDLAPPKLTVPATCASANVTAQQVYDGAYKTGCTPSGCHGSGNITHFGAASAAAMRTAWLGVNADQPTGLPYVTASNVDRSYVLFKLLGQQDRVADAISRGSKMPLGASLTDAQICLFINWVRSGAPN